MHWLHWLRVAERITYTVAVLTYRALTGDVPQYLQQFVRVADVPSRHRLRSSSDDLIVPAVRLTSIGSRAFPVTGASICNTLPLHVASASSPTAFKQRLELNLFCFSVLGLSPVWLLSGPCTVCCHLSLYKQETQLIADKPRDAFRGQSRSITKHGIIRYVRYPFLIVCYSNFVRKTRRFSDIRLQKMSWPRNPGQKSLKVIENVTIR